MKTVATSQAMALRHGLSPHHLLPGAAMIGLRSNGLHTMVPEPRVAAVSEAMPAASLAAKEGATGAHRARVHPRHRAARTGRDSSPRRPLSPGLAAESAVPSLPAPGRQGWLLKLLAATLEAARPRQWPKNLLVFAVPLAAASVGRAAGFGYALVAGVAFTAASATVYLVNDVVDAGRDRRHPAKRHRPVASGRLPELLAMSVAGVSCVLAITVALRVGPVLASLICGYVILSILYTVWLKHIPWVEVGFVAVGFVLRALGGAVATQVPPSGWFLTVCSLGALTVALGKRHTELSLLGSKAARHRPVMRWYSQRALRAGQRAVIGAMLAAYLLWALGEPAGRIRGWHLASGLALAAAMWRFDRLTGRAEDRPVEDLISRDAVMVSCEATWLVLFLAGI